MTRMTLQGFVKLFRPLFLLGGILLYALGAGIARFLGNNIDWQAYLLGQACATLLQLAPIFLKEYFDSFSTPPRPFRRPENQSEEKVPYTVGRLPALLISATILTVGAVLTVLLYRNGNMKLEAFTIVGIAFLITFFYATPPVRLIHSGYGELATAIIMSNLIPAFAFLLQAGGFHRLLAMATFPLTPIYLAMTLALSLPTYATDIKYENRTLLVRMGWQRAMSLHNVLILRGFLLIALAMVLGLSWHVIWPVFLALPVGLFQIWQMDQIKEGAKPRFRLLTVTAIATFGLVAYLFAFTFWTG